jgi:hypothetical protein
MREGCEHSRKGVSMSKSAFLSSTISLTVRNITLWLVMLVPELLPKQWGKQRLPLLRGNDNRVSGRASD